MKTTLEKPNHRSLTLAAQSEVPRCRAATVGVGAVVFNRGLTSSRERVKIAKPHDRGSASLRSRFGWSRSRVKLTGQSPPCCCPICIALPLAKIFLPRTRARPCLRYSAAKPPTPQIAAFLASLRTKGETFPPLNKLAALNHAGSMRGAARMDSEPELWFDLAESAGESAALELDDSQDRRVLCRYMVRNPPRKAQLTATIHDLTTARCRS